MILAFGPQTLEQLGNRCTRVWLERLGFAETHQRIRFFGTGGDDAARTMVLE